MTLILQPKAIVHAADGHRLLEEVERWMDGLGSPIERLADPEEVFEVCLRSRPRFVLLALIWGSSFLSIKVAVNVLALVYV